MQKYEKRSFKRAKQEIYKRSNYLQELWNREKIGWEIV